MSEYQYYEWQTVDRLLTPAEQAAVNGLSSHMEVSSSKAVVTYNWSDFRHDPKQVLLKYFDAHFYQSNWGSLQLMFRFPKGLLDETGIETYLNLEYAALETIGEYQILDLHFESEDGGWMEEVDGGLSDFIGLRADLIQGDYRLLYLAWLKQMTLFGEPDDDWNDDEESVIHDLEPPVPPGLKKLSPALQSILRVFEIDPLLVRAAAEASPDMRNPLPVDYRELLSRLPESERDDFLVRLAEGDAVVGLALRKRLTEFLPKDKQPTVAGKRTFGELFQQARELKAADKIRKAEEARKKHIAEMKSLAERESQVWQEVDRILENGPKSASVYDEATGLLKKLQDLAEFQDTRDVFRTRVHQLAEKYASRPSLMKRWTQNGWL